MSLSLWRQLVPNSLSTKIIDSIHWWGDIIEPNGHQPINRGLTVMDGAYLFNSMTMAAHSEANDMAIIIINSITLALTSTNGWRGEQAHMAPSLLSRDLQPNHWLTNGLIGGRRQTKWKEKITENLLITFSNATTFNHTYDGNQIKRALTARTTATCFCSMSEWIRATSKIDCHDQSTDGGLLGLLI